MEKQGTVEGSGLQKLADQQTQEAQKGMIGLDINKKPAGGYSFAPETEKLFQSAKGIKPESIPTHLKESAIEIGHKFTRDYEHLSNTPENAQLIFDLKKLEKQKDVVADRTIRTIGETLSGLSKKEYDIFTRKVILDDLMSDVEGGLYKDKELPFKFTPESLTMERSKLNAEINTNPKIIESLDKRNAVWEQVKTEYVDALKPFKPHVEDMFKENYYRHQVLGEVAEKGMFGTGKRLKTPSRGYMKQRTGYKGLYNTDYLEAEHNIMAQMLHDIEVAKTLTKINEAQNIVKNIKAKAKEEGLDNWHDAIPEGYTTWQPKEGNVFYPALSISEKAAAKIMAGELEELAGMKNPIKEILALGGKREEWVVRHEVAETLDNLVRERPRGKFSQAEIATMTKWKQWQLISPRRVVKYNTRNLTGDAEAVFLGNPSGFLKSKQAVKELGDVMFGKGEMSPGMKAWFERGGMLSNLQAQEMGSLKKLWMFSRLYEGKGTNLWTKYWRGVRLLTDYRESILRYANFLDYKEQLLKGEGKPKNYGASKPEVIDALSDINDKAYWLSNDLLGAYDRVSVAGQSIRERWVPFWSWQEVNAKRYIQLYRNASNQGSLAMTIGRHLGAATPLAALKLGRFTLKVVAFKAALWAWNNGMFPDEEKVMPKDIKKTSHIILSKNDKGEVEYFSRLGTLDDFISWVGLDYTPELARDWLQGKETFKETLKKQGEQTLKAPINKLVGGGIPFTKLLFETLSRRSTFPDIFKQGTVRDKWLHVARSIGLENEYKLMAGQPSKGYGKSVKDVFVYTIDPNEASYRNVFDMKNDYLKKLGKSSEGFWLTQSGDALYNLKLAVKYNDKEAFAKYFSKYATLMGQQGKGKEQVIAGIKSTLSTMHPLYGMDRNIKIGFISSLNKDEQDELVNAVKFYNETLLGNKQNKEAVK
jgi:hypothetical protein